ncbi:MAG: hypothetical protein LBE62_11295 [Azonexus sp.]|jgi:photosystem II stability/assembly factor-like uncharacterized protein|nr:hypothetical protein [Azonexus sp.]
MIVCLKASRWLFAVAILAALGFVRPGQAAPVRADLMDTPAGQNERARSAVLMAVAAAGQRLVAVGERGTVLLSDNNGQDWRQAKAAPTSVALTAVSFISADVGWAVGHSGMVLKTTDGGETWEKQLDGKQAAAIEAAAADAATTATAAVENASAPTRRQRDARRLIDDGADKPFLDVLFTDAQNGLVVGAYGLAFGTRDGGQSWQSLIGQIDNPESRHLYKITPIGADGGLMLVGEQGLLLKSPAAGRPFAKIPFTYPGTLFGELVAPDHAILVFGLRGNAFRSLDDGVNWHKVDFGPPVTLTAGTRMKDGRLAVVDEAGRILLSSDDGATFALLASGKINAATGVVEAADGGLVVATQRGPARIPPETLNAEAKK